MIYTLGRPESIGNLPLYAQLYYLPFGHALVDPQGFEPWSGIIQHTHDAQVFKPGFVY